MNNFTLLPDDVLGAVGLLLDFTLESVRRGIIITKLWISVAQVTFCGLTFTLHVVAICLNGIGKLCCPAALYLLPLWVQWPFVISYTSSVNYIPGEAFLYHGRLLQPLSLKKFGGENWSKSKSWGRVHVHKFIVGLGGEHVLPKHNWGHNHTIYYYRTFSNMLLSAL